MSEEIEKILENVENKTGCFDFLATITPNATDQLIEKLQQENQQLKEKYNIRSKAYNEVLLENASLKEENSQLKLDYELYKDNFVYRNYEVEIRDNTIKQLEEVIEEVREYMKENRTRYIYQDGLGEDWWFEDLNVYSELLQILDKVKEN